MGTTIIIIGFSIYTLILIGLLIWFIKSNKEAMQHKKWLKKDGILTQARIIDTWHPKSEKGETNILDDDRTTSAYDKRTELMIEYEHQITSVNSTTENFIGIIQVYLNFRNVDTEKEHYEIGRLMDIIYLKGNPTIANLAKYIRSPEENISFLSIIITALASSIFGLVMALFVGFSNHDNNIETGLMMLACFLMYVFLLAGAIFILFGAIMYVKEYRQLRQIRKRGLRETGKVLNTWRVSGSKGTTSYYIKYTYPAIAPFHIESMIDREIFYELESKNELDVYYLKEKKFNADIVGNKNIVSAFRLFLIFAPLMVLFMMWMFYLFLLSPFL